MTGSSYILIYLLLVRSTVAIDTLWGFRQPVDVESSTVEHPYLDTGGGVGPGPAELDCPGHLSISCSRGGIAALEVGRGLCNVSLMRLFQEEY